MKCHKCGAYIPEGHMYCDECGAEIKIVPDFEPEIENEIDSTMSSIAGTFVKDENNKKREVQEKDEEEDDVYAFIRDKRKTVLGFAGVVAAVIMIVVIVFIFQDRNGNRYINLAREARESGNTYKAVAYLTEGNKKNPRNINIIFELSDCYLELGAIDNAVATLRIVTDSEIFTKDSVTLAYESIISIYKQSGEYDKIAQILNEDQNESAVALRKKYIPKPPEMTPEADTYEEFVSIELSGGEGDVIYYTINGGVPDKKCTVYRRAIDLSVDDEYNIKAVAVNEYGISSEVVENTYIVEKGAAPDPEVMEPSGDYTQNTMIVVVPGEGCTVYYTTDGSDPDMDSLEYTEPIPMPLGSSKFKFIAYNEKGNPSEIVEREFHFAYPRKVSKEQAVKSLVNKLLQLDVLLDEKGSVRGGGRNEYIYQNIIEVPGAGEYYKIDEEFVRADGTRSKTGRFFAINTNDGSLNHLGYDTSGRYTLKLIK